MLTGKTLEIRLLGQKMALRTKEADPAFAEAVVELVSARIETAEKRARGSAPHQVALLALLDLAEEYLRAKARTKDFKEAAQDKVNELASLVTPT